VTHAGFALAASKELFEVKRGLIFIPRPPGVDGECNPAAQSTDHAHGFSTRAGFPDADPPGHRPGRPVLGCLVPGQSHHLGDRSRRQPRLTTAGPSDRADPFRPGLREPATPPAPSVRVDLTAAGDPLIRPLRQRPTAMARAAPPCGAPALSIWPSGSAQPAARWSPAAPAQSSKDNWNTILSRGRSISGASDGFFSSTPDWGRTRCVKIGANVRGDASEVVGPQRSLRVAALRERPRGGQAPPPETPPAQSLPSAQAPRLRGLAW
jgi:hypothetical protein